MSDAPEEGRLKAKVAIIVGAGQTPGDTIGNGRATALLFAREGAKVFAVDRDIDRAQETVDLILGEEGEAAPFAADITREEDCIALAKACVEAYGRIDILHNNVGIGRGDTGPVHLTDRIGGDAVFSRRQGNGTCPRYRVRKRTWRFPG